MVYARYLCLCSCVVVVVGITTEESLIGRRLNVHPIEAKFSAFVEENKIEEVNSMAYHRAVVEQFCSKHGSSTANKKNECTYEEYYNSLFVLRKPFANHFDPYRMRVDPEEVIEPWFQEENTCKRISNPTEEEFMAFVARSEPVIITDWANEWKSVKKWTWEYLLQEIGEQPCVVSGMSTYVLFHVAYHLMFSFSKSIF